MKKNLIFKLCFIVGIFLIILTACDLGTKQWANLTFSLEGPTLEGRATQEGRSSSSRYIHPDADYLIFELFSGNTSLSKTTQSITDGKDISIRLEKVPLNDPNLRAEIEVRGNQTGSNDPSLLGQNSIHLGRIGLGYTKLTLGVKPVGNYLGTATYEEDGDDIYIELNIPNPDNPFFVCWEIKMLSQKGLYTIEAQQKDLVLYASDGRQYKNTHPIPGIDGTTLVFYHPKDEASTYYLAHRHGYNVNITGGTKLEQDILITRESDTADYEVILTRNPDEVDFNPISEKLSFTIYNPYSSELKLRATIGNETGQLDADTIPGNDKFRKEHFPTSLPPGKSEEFDIIFDRKEKGGFSADFTIQAAGLDDFVLNLVGSNYSD